MQIFATVLILILLTNRCLQLFKGRLIIIAPSDKKLGCATQYVCVYFAFASDNYAEWAKGAEAAERVLLITNSPFGPSGLLAPLRPFYKSCAKRTTLLRQNFVMPRLCYGSAEQVSLLCSRLNRKVHFSPFSFHFRKVPTARVRS